MEPQTEPLAKVRSLDSHIEATPGVCGGKPRISGHRIKVEQIAILHERLGQSVASILVEYPQLSPSDIHAALAYYYDHRDEIDKDIAAGQQLVEEMKKRYPSRLNAKLSKNGE